MEYKILTNNSDIALALFSFVTSKDVIKDLDGYPIYNDSCCIWIIAIEENQVIGFSGFRINGNNKIDLKESYIIPEYRRKGIYSVLFSMREKYIGKKIKNAILKGIANKNSRHVFEKNNYILKRQTKNFFFFEKIL